MQLEHLEKIFVERAIAHYMDYLAKEIIHTNKAGNDSSYQVSVWNSLKEIKRKIFRD